MPCGPCECGTWECFTSRVGGGFPCSPSHVLVHGLRHVLNRAVSFFLQVTQSPEGENQQANSRNERLGFEPLITVLLEAKNCEVKILRLSSGRAGIVWGASHRSCAGQMSVLWQEVLVHQLCGKYSVRCTVPALLGGFKMWQ